MENSNLAHLIWGIIKAILLFIFRIAILGVMIVVTVALAIAGAREGIGEAIWKCICQPFTALAEAIRNISYEIKVYKENKT